MTGHPASDPALQASDAAFDETGVKRELTGAAWKLVAGVALAFSTYQLIVAAFSPLSSLPTRSLHVGFLLALSFLIYPIGKRANRSKIAWFDLALAALGAALSLYHLVFEADLVQRSGDPTVIDLAVGSIVIVLLFEAARRVLGVALPIVCGTFLAYGLFGQFLPSAIAHRGYGFDQIVGQLFLGTEGIYGIPTLVSATYIFLFILFGSFLEHAGMISLFNNIALGFVGHARGGPAKVAVISSGMMGMISGSGVANVLTVGQFTIPLMKRFGYTSVFAGAVEATASMGGQIMPPVMGAVAFIMAETLNVPYVTIVKAAIIPAVLYYLTAFCMVHLEAGRMGLHGIPKAECPNPWQAIRSKWYLMLPLAVLVFMLFDGFTPMFSGIVGLAMTAVLILGTGIAGGFNSMAFRIAFWVALGVASATFFKFGVWPIIAMIALLVAVNFVIKGGRETLAIMRESLIGGARQAIAVGIACAIVGVIIGVLTLTGAASNFAGFVLEIGARSLLLSLLLTMIVCLILGHGHSDHPELHHYQRDCRSGIAQVGRAADRLAHVRVLFRHHGRPDAPSGAGRVCRGIDRQGIAHEDRLEGHAHCHRRLRDSVHGGVRPILDAPERNAVRYGLCRVQGHRRDRAMGRGVHRLPSRSAQLAGTYFGYLCCVPACGRRTLDRRSRDSRLVPPSSRGMGIAPAAQRLAQPAEARLVRDIAALNVICLVVAGVVRATLPGPDFTLAWQHSVEKIRWEERYRLTGDQLTLYEARIEGNGAGMESPPGARLQGGQWVWQPTIDARRTSPDPFYVYARLHPLLGRPLR